MTKDFIVLRSRQSRGSTTFEPTVSQPALALQENSAIDSLHRESYDVSNAAHTQYPAVSFSHIWRFSSCQLPVQLLAEIKSLVLTLTTTMHTPQTAVKEIPLEVSLFWSLPLT